MTLNSSPSELTEEDLLQKTGRGDSRAFDHFYTAVAPRVYGLLRQLLPDEREAEEALQDGFTMVWEQAASFDPSREKALTWAARIFRQRALDRMRALGRRNRRVERSVINDSQLVEPASGDDQGGRVHEAFGKLPEDQRQIIGAAFLKGLNHHVVADALGIPPESVRTLVRRGVLRLHELLKGES